MDVVYSRCCGLDVPKRTVVACLIVSEADGPPRKEIRTFETHTDDLLKLADWLSVEDVTHVAMEATGAYWKPVWNLLEGNNLTLLLVNAAHIKAVPGRKTDVHDSEWIADLLRHGLLRGSFVPDRPQRELRELTRYRTSLVRERSAEVNRLQKTLEGANIKLASVATDVLGRSGREMLPMPWWRAPLIRPSSPNWPRESCGRRFPSWSVPWWGGLARTSASCWGACSFPR